MLAGVRTCPRCGLSLPNYARFCARCGAQQPALRDHVDTWVLVLFGVGTALTAVGALIYIVAAIDPGIGAANHLDSGTIRAGAIVLTLVLGTLCTLQAAAIVGLVRGSEWGRVAATVACVLWCVTCVGLPPALLVLNSIWRRRPSAAI
jgi:hypothetical protein